MAKISDEERFVNALDKLLASYGVDDEKLRTDFITDFKNEVDDAVDGEEEVDTETEVEDAKEVKGDEQEQQADEGEVNDEVEPTEEPETIEPEPMVEDEQKKTIDGLVARIETLENIVSKLGVPEKDESFGASPVAEPTQSDKNNAFDKYVNARKGQ